MNKRFPLLVALDFLVLLCLLVILGVSEALRWAWPWKSKVGRELVFASYDDAEMMIRSSMRWRVAPEEDHNQQDGFVWLERDL